VNRREEQTLKLETIRLDRPADGVVVATLDRPERMNAMTMIMFAELERLAVTLDEEEDLRVLNAGNLTRENARINAEIRCYAEFQALNSCTRTPRSTDLPRYLELRDVPHIPYTRHP
jgi:hypothetical protein